MLDVNSVTWVQILLYPPKGIVKITKDYIRIVHGDYMSNLVSVVFILFAIIFPPEKQPDYIGYAPHYGVNVMERVAIKRDLPIVHCMVSSPYEQIGTWVTVRSRVNGKVLACRVTDVSANKDRARHKRLKRVIELNWTSAKILCELRYVGEKSPKQCPVEVTVLK